MVLKLIWSDIIELSVCWKDLKNGWQIKTEEFGPEGKLIKHGKLVQPSIPDTEKDNLASTQNIVQNIVQNNVQNIVQPSIPDTKKDNLASAQGTEQNIQTSCNVMFYTFTWTWPG